jgi:hypothetical protein
MTLFQETITPIIQRSNTPLNHKMVTEPSIAATNQYQVE